MKFSSFVVLVPFVVFIYKKILTPVKCQVGLEGPLVTCIQIIDHLLQNLNCRPTYIQYEGDLVTRVVNGLKHLREAIIILNASLNARKDEEDYEALQLLHADYLKDFGEAVKHITEVVCDIAFVIDESILKQDKISLADIIKECDAWQSFCQLVIEELDDGVPQYLINEDEENWIEDPREIIKKIESLYKYSSAVYLGKIEEAMRKALKKKNSPPTPKMFGDCFVIVKQQFSRVAMVGVDLNFDFDIRCYKPYSVSYIWYKEEVADSLHIVWKRVHPSRDTYKPVLQDFGKHLKLECYVTVGWKTFLT
ncbi:hypothetical protein COLO4_29069 [Corchorus olitorius]|uniref:Uncharacterized protein n=1 Tax=Corchorus olitorius TaxID=93759 RepID=A0A1R3HGI4_9ROSI|nr:hypothetical protein COLO4_29069 [Corchorus olitorius]